MVWPRHIGATRAQEELNNHPPSQAISWLREPMGLKCLLYTDPDGIGTQGG